MAVADLMTLRQNKKSDHSGWLAIELISIGRMIRFTAGPLAIELIILHRSTRRLCHR